MANNRVLITGVSGFTGRYLVEYIREIDPDIPISGVDVQAPDNLYGCAFTRIDLQNYSEISRVITEINPAYIFHLGGVNFSDQPQHFFDVNVVGTLNLLEAVRNAAEQIDPTILIVGSSAEYGMVNEDEHPVSEHNPLRPVSHYGVSKVAQDLLGFQYFMSFGLKVIRVRPFNLIGPGQSADYVCGSLVQQFAEIEQGIRSPEILTGNQTPERDFIDVRDLVKAYWMLMMKGTPGEVYNIGSGESASVRDVLQILLESTRMDITVTTDPGKERQSDIPRMVSDITRITSQVGWTPTISLEVALYDMLQHARKTCLDSE
ncbi:GDP-mannose 4,6-dehydratase [Gemmatimonadota bacterium]